MLFLFYTDLLTDWGRTAPQVLGQSGSYIKGIMIFIPPDCTIVFSSFFFLFLSRRQNAFEQCSCGITISATALFKVDVNLSTGKDILEKAM